MQCVVFGLENVYSSINSAHCYQTVYFETSIRFWILKFCWNNTFLFLWILLNNSTKSAESKWIIIWNDIFYWNKDFFHPSIWIVLSETEILNVNLLKKQHIDNPSYEICGFKIIPNLTHISKYIINSNKPCPTISINPFAQLTQHETISSAVPVFFPHFSKQLLITFRGVAMPTEPTEAENNRRGNQYHTRNQQQKQKYYQNKSSPQHETTT